MTFLNAVGLGALRLMSRLYQWLGRTFNTDRTLAVVGVLITILSTVLSVVLTLAPAYAVTIGLASFPTSLLILLIMVVLFRSGRSNLSVLPPDPYRIRSKEITLDISSPSGCDATISFEEENVSLQDNLSIVRKSFWGDWEPLTLADFTCSCPKTAAVVDMFHEGYAVLYLISLRHLYNYKEPFRLKYQLAVRNGFTQRSEYYCYTTMEPVDLLQFTIILPHRKQFHPNSLMARRGYVGFHKYKERPVEPDCVSLNEDGREQVTYKWRPLQKGTTYSLYWNWDPDCVDPIDRQLKETH